MNSEGKRQYLNLDVVRSLFFLRFEDENLPVPVVSMLGFFLEDDSVASDNYLRALLEEVKHLETQETVEKEIDPDISDLKPSQIRSQIRERMDQINENNFSDSLIYRVLTAGDKFKDLFYRLLAEGMTQLVVEKLEISDGDRERLIQHLLNPDSSPENLRREVEDRTWSDIMEQVTQVAKWLVEHPEE